MYLIALFFLLLAYFSLLMVLNPSGFAKGIINFSEKWYFHPFEICSRILVGLVFIYFAETTAYPVMFSYIGYLLVAVGVGLACTPPRLHKGFAVMAAQRFERLFRPIGLFTIPLGIVMAYIAINGPI